MHSRLKLVVSSLLLILFVLPVSFSCKKKKAKNQKELDEQIIKDYISKHNLSATATGTGLYYVMTSQGTGTQPTISSTVTVAYKGYLTDGKTFDQSSSSGATFPLQSVIRGWQEGIPLYKKGGKGILLIPSELGYGSKTQNKIPANSVLIFDVELLNVQ